MIQLPFLRRRRLQKLHMAWETAKAEVRNAEAVRDTRRIHAAIASAQACCKAVMLAEAGR